MDTTRSRDGRYELRHESELNRDVEAYGDSDEEQHDHTWAIVHVASGKEVARYDGTVNEQGFRTGTESVAFAGDGRGLLVNGKRVALDDLARRAGIAKP